MREFGGAGGGSLHIGALLGLDAAVVSVRWPANRATIERSQLSGRRRHRKDKTIVTRQGVTVRAQLRCDEARGDHTATPPAPQGDSTQTERAARSPAWEHASSSIRPGGSIHSPFCHCPQGRQARANDHRAAVTCRDAAARGEADKCWCRGTPIAGLAWVKLYDVAADAFAAVAHGHGDADADTIVVGDSDRLDLHRCVAKSEAERISRGDSRVVEVVLSPQRRIFNLAGVPVDGGQVLAPGRNRNRQTAAGLGVSEDDVGQLGGRTADEPMSPWLSDVARAPRTATRVSGPRAMGSTGRPAAAWLRNSTVERTAASCASARCAGLATMLAGGAGRVRAAHRICAARILWAARSMSLRVSRPSRSAAGSARARCR